MRYHGGEKRQPHKTIVGWKVVDRRGEHWNRTRIYKFAADARAAAELINRERGENVASHKAIWR